PVADLRAGQVEPGARPARRVVDAGKLPHVARAPPVGQQLRRQARRALIEPVRDLGNRDHQIRPSITSAMSVSAAASSRAPAASIATWQNVPSSPRTVHSTCQLPRATPAILLPVTRIPLAGA